MLHLARACFLMLGLASPVLAANWPAWRGPDGQGCSTESNLPLKWSASENVRWKVPLPDEGNSTPIIWGDRIFLTQATDKVDWPPKPGNGGIASAHHRILMCFSRTDGKLLWQRQTIYKETESTHPTNPFCSASPVTDGERVIVSHGSAGMFCYDLDGKELWRRDLGKFEHVWGNAASPTLYGELAILWCGPGERQFLLAVNKKTGQTVWEQNESGGTYGKSNKDWIGSWSTPVIARVDCHDELILGVPDRLKGFDPKTGKELWSCDGLSKLVYTSAVCSPNGIIVAMSGFHGPAMAVKAGGKGDVTKTHRLWRHEGGIPQRIGTGVILGEHLYMVNENGVAQCLDLKSGKDLWEKERATSSTWGSLIAAGGRLYVTAQNGETVVLAADPKFEILAKNPLDKDDHVRASIAVADGELFIRTYKRLWCIGARK